MGVEQYGIEPRPEMLLLLDTAPKLGFFCIPAPPAAP